MIRVYPDPPPTAPTHTKPRLDKHVLLLKLNHYQHANDNPCLQSGSLTTKSSTAKTGASSFIRRMATLTNRCRILWDHSGANTMRNHRQNSVQLQNNLANRVDINEMLIEAVPYNNKCFPNRSSSLRIGSKKLVKEVVDQKEYARLMGNYADEIVFARSIDFYTLSKTCRKMRTLSDVDHKMHSKTLHKLRANVSTSPRYANTSLLANKMLATRRIQTAKILPIKVPKQRLIMTRYKKIKIYNQDKTPQLLPWLGEAEIYIHEHIQLSPR